MITSNTFSASSAFPVSYFIAIIVSAISQHVTPDMQQFLQRLRARVRVGVVGGSDLNKIKEQLGEDGETKV